MARYVAERGWELDVITFPPEYVESPEWRTLADLPPGTRVYGIPSPVVPIARLIDSVWRLLRTLRSKVANHASDDVGASTSPGPQGRPDSLLRSEIRWSLTELRTYVRAYNVWVTCAVAARWARQASALARHILAPGVHDAIISSGPPHAAHDAARLTSRYSGIPFVIDMRDVLGLTQRFLESVASPLMFHVIQRQERRLVNEAALVVVNTDVVRSAMIQEYPEARDRILTVTNGFDDDSLPRTQHGSQFIVGYAGSIYMGRDPACLFQAARQVVDELSLAPGDFALKFIGANDRGISLTEMADAEGIGAFVHVDGPCSRAEAREFLARTQMLVILPQDWDMSIPAKLFEYVRFEAWLLALAERDSATERILRDTEADVVPPSDISTIAAVLRTRYEQFVAGTRPGRIARDVRLSRRFQAAVLLDALERCVHPSPIRQRPIFAAG